jgi:hypothetical protein
MWLALLGIRHHLSRGPPSTSSRKVVGAPGSPASPPRGPAIDIFKINVGRSRTSDTPPPQGACYLFNWQDKNSEKPSGEMICWPHHRIRSLSQGGLRGHYRYPADRVPMRTSFKIRQVAGRASTRCHVPCSFGPCPLSG